MTAPAITAARSARPYPGMRPFQVNEADIFFGQDRQIADLLHRLGNSRLIGVLGESGCGKSSLVKAGLISRLAGANPKRRDRLWRIAISQPGRSPIATLADRLSAESALAIPRDDLERMLRSSSFGLMEAIKAAKLAPPCRVLVVIDQFEELFRFCKEDDEGQPGQGRSGALNKLDEAALFVKLLLTVAGHSGSPDATQAYVVLTMRSEYLGDCASFFGLAEAMNEGAYLLPKLTRSNIESAILGPLHRVGGEIDNDLLQDLLNETVQAHEDGLPLLQHALRRIWDNAQTRGALHLTRQDVGDLPADTQGSLLLEKLLNAHLDSIYKNDLKRNQQEIAARLFRQLGEYDTKGRLVRRSRDFRAAAAVCRTPESAVLAVVDAFRDENQGRTFLMPPREATEKMLAGEEPLDLSHEALLRRWDRLGDWIRQEDNDATLFRSLADRVNRDSAVLRGRELRRIRKWVREFQPTAVWAERYQGSWDPSLGRHQYDYDATMRYIRRSRMLGIVRGVAYAAIALGVVALSYGALQNDRARRADALKAAMQSAYSRAQEDARNQYLKQLEAKNSKLTDAQTKLTESLGKEQKARGAAESERKKAVEAQQVAENKTKEAQSLNEQLTQQKTALAGQNAQLEQTSTLLKKNQTDLESRNTELQAAQEKIKQYAARRVADAGFTRLANQPPEYSRAAVASRLWDLSDAIASYDAAYHQLPAGSMAALVQAVSLSYLFDSDTSGTDPVLFTMPHSSGGGLVTVRSGALPLDWGIKVPRKSWSIQQANPLPDGQTMSVGGVGGYVAFTGAQKSPIKSHKLDPFAITALGASTDGEWIATASASGDMRVFRYSSFASNRLFKDRLLQFGNAAKLVGFLMIHRYAGEYPVRQFSISVAPHPGRQSEKEDLDVVALTESGQLLRWVHPGPIGKQLSRLDNLLIDTGSGTARAIATNPATQVVWAAVNDTFGIVRNRQFVKIGSAPNGATISAMSWNANGSLLAVGLRNGSLCIYQPRDTSATSALDLVVRIPGHSSVLTTLTWSGSTLASGSTDGSARLWKLESLVKERPLLNLLATAAAGESKSTDAQGLEKQYAALAPYLKTRLDAIAVPIAH